MVREHRWRGEVRRNVKMKTEKGDTENMANYMEDREIKHREKIHLL